MTSTTLTQRERDILGCIVEEYLAHASPVGSRTVSKRCGLGLSPASVRNVMADLTDKGYLSQPHTSAGRRPTHTAVRHYLDSATFAPLTTEAREAIARELAGGMAKGGLELADVLRNASHLLADAAQQVGVVLSPSAGDVRWKEIDFTLIKPGLVLVILVLEGGILQNRAVEIPTEVTSEDLEKYRNYLNEHYRGHSLAEARGKIMRELKRTEQRLKRLYRRALDLADAACRTMDTRELYLDGAMHILRRAEDANLTRIREVFALLDEKSRLLDLVERTMAREGVRITLGEEALVEELAEMSVISSAYGAEHHTSDADDQAAPSGGVISVIGPMGMDYARVVPVVEHISKTLTHLLINR